MRVDLVRRYADMLWSAAETRTPCSPLTEATPDLTEEEAYEIQRINAKRQGVARLGYKVGLTSREIQEWLGVDEPDLGVLLNGMCVDDGGTIRADRLLQPRAEAELAFTLDRPLSGPATTITDVLAATAFVSPSIEVIDSRIADWRIKHADTVADNGSSGVFVLGGDAASPIGLPLRTAGVVLRKNGEVVATGAGAASLGHPAAPVAWLVRRLARWGGRLEAGEVVISGALCPVTPITHGDQLEAEIAGVGTVRANVVGVPAVDASGDAA